MASFTPSNPPTNLTMLDMKAALDNLGGPAKQCRFAVKISPVGSENYLTQLGYTNNILRDFVLMCESTELPGRGFEPTETRYYGPSMQLPRNVKYNNDMSMTFLCRNGSWERQLFDDWMELINPSSTFNFNYPRNYMCELHVYTFSDARGPGFNINAPMATYQWTLRQAWPALVNPQQVTWADNDILRLSVSFYYRYWIRPGRDSSTVAPFLQSSSLAVPSQQQSALGSSAPAGSALTPNLTLDRSL